jgi:hypothetical protein
MARKKTSDFNPMKRMIIPSLFGLATALLLAGCACSFQFGGGKKDSSSSTNTTSNTSTSNTTQPGVVQQTSISPTIGQQLIDLKKAKDSGAITEAEYEAEKAKLLNGK